MILTWEMRRDNCLFILINPLDNSTGQVLSEQSRAARSKTVCEIRCEGVAAPAISTSPPARPGPRGGRGLIQPAALPSHFRESVNESGAGRRPQRIPAGIH